MREQATPKHSWTTAAALALVLASGTAPAPAEPPPEESGVAGGRDEVWWREEHELRAGHVEYLEALVGECEEREAPGAYDAVDGYVVPGRRGPRWVRIKRCDEERAALEAACGDLDRFEERARELGVPPGWLR